MTVLLATVLFLIVGLAAFVIEGGFDGSEER